VKRILKLTDDRRTPVLNKALGCFCAFVSGSINAGGFIILGHYTSHVTGMIAGAADAIVLKQWTLLETSLAFVGSFFLGAFFATLLIQIAEALKLHSRFALAFLASGMLLIALGFWSYLNGMCFYKSMVLDFGFFFSMGIQNATVTRLSNYDIRATHMTGLVTDLGIECGKWTFNRKSLNQEKLTLLLLILFSFFIGGVCGAYSFNSHLGTLSLFLYGGVLAFLAIFPIYKDTHIRLRFLRRANRK